MTTDQGGSIAFLVDTNAVTSLQIVDPQAQLELTQPTGIEGNTFSVENSEGVSSPTSPAVAIQGVFDSETQASEIYSISQGGQQWSGSLTTSKQ